MAAETAPATPSSLTPARCFRGWIPTITGLLSFNFIGEARSRNDTFCGRASLSGSRSLVCYQRRNTSDVPIRPRILKEFILNCAGKTGEFVFLCIGHDAEYSEHDRGLHKRATRDETKLQGNLFIFPVKKPDSWTKSLESLVDRAIDKLQTLAQQQRLQDIDTYGSSPDADEDPVAVACKAEIEQIMAAAQKNAMFFVEFSLLRNGICTFSVPPGVTELSNFHSMGRNGDSETRRPQTYTLELTQLFMFLKDLSHHHRHHPSTSDNLTRLYPLDLSETIDDVAWRRRTLQTLYRHVTDLRRNKDQLSLANAKGFLAYARSFSGISKDVLDGKSNVAPVIDKAELDASIASAGETAALTAVSARYLRGSFLNSVIGAIALVLATTALLQITTYQVDPFHRNSVASQPAGPSNIKFVPCNVPTPMGSCWGATLGYWMVDVPAEFVTSAMVAVIPTLARPAPPQQVAVATPQATCKASGYRADSCPWIVALAHWVIDTPLHFGGTVVACFLAVWCFVEYRELSQTVLFRPMVYFAHAFRRKTVGWGLMNIAVVLSFISLSKLLVPPAESLLRKFFAIFGL